MVVTSDFGSESPGSSPGSPTKYSFARETAYQEAVKSAE